MANEQAYKEFKAHKRTAKEAEELSGDEGIASPNVTVRKYSRESALNYALENIVQGDAQRNELIRNRARISDSTYDEWLASASQISNSRAVNAFFTDRNGVIDAVPNDVLARNYLVFPGREIKEDDAHNKVVKLHERYLELDNIIKAYKGGKIKDEGNGGMFKIAINYLQSLYTADDSDSAEDNATRKTLYQAAIYSMSISDKMGAAVINDGLANIEEKIDKYLPDEKARIDYAKKNLAHSADEIHKKHSTLERQLEKARTENDEEAVRNLDGEYKRSLNEKYEFTNRFYDMITMR